MFPTLLSQVTFHLFLPQKNSGCTKYKTNLTVHSVNVEALDMASNVCTSHFMYFLWSATHRTHFHLARLMEQEKRKVKEFNKTKGRSTTEERSLASFQQLIIKSHLLQWQARKL